MSDNRRNAMRGVAALWLWALCGALVPAGASGQGGRPVLEDNLAGVLAEGGGWSRINFSPEVALQLTTGTEDGVDFLRFRAGDEGLSLFSIHRPLAARLGVAGKHMLRVRYRGDVDGPIHFFVSRSPGQGPPSIAQKAPYLADGQWHWAELEFDLAGFAPGPLLLEFGPWGLVKPGHYMDLADLRLDFVPAPVLRARLCSPGTGALPGNDPDQKVLLDILMDGEAGPVEVHAEAALHDGGDTVASASRVLSESGTLELDLAGAPPGYYQVLVRAGADRLIGDYIVWKSPPVEWTANPIRDYVPHVGDDPFLFIGIYHASDPVLERINRANAEMGLEEITRREMLADLKARHFTVVHHSWTDASDAFYRDAGEAGLMVLPETGHDLEAVKRSRSRPNVYGWYGLDEPSVLRKDECRALYVQYKQLDPQRPVMTAIHKGGLGFGDTRFLDIALPNPYPFARADSPALRTWQNVRDCRDYLLGDDPRTAVLLVPHLFSADGLCHGHIPTYAQLRCEVYTGLAAGARGVFYYAYYTHEELADGMPRNPRRKHWFLPESELWDQIGGLNRELVGLSDIILGGTVDEGLRMRGESAACIRGVRADKRRVVIVTNPMPEALAGLSFEAPGWGGLRVLSGPEPRETEPGLWELELPGYGVAVYEAAPAD